MTTPTISTRPSDRRAFLRAMLAAAPLAAVAACASGGAASGGSNSRVLTREDMTDYLQQDLHEAILRLRRNWLRRRAAGGTSGTDAVQVHVNGARMGGVNALRDIRVSNVARVEYMSGTDATTRYGTGYGGGAILVTTR